MQRQKYTIVLRGTANSGKTETLTILYSLLKHDGAEEIAYAKPNAHDLWSILKFNDVKVAISTQGDSKEDLEKWHRFVDEQQIDIGIFVFPCRTGGTSFNFATSLFLDAQTIWYGRWYVNDDISKCEVQNPVVSDLRTQANHIQAEFIRKTIHLLVTDERRQEL